MNELLRGVASMRFSPLRAVLLSLISLAAGTSASGQEVVGPRRAASPRYPEIKNRQDQALGQAITNTERLDALRATVRSGRHSGESRLQSMFNNLEGDFAFDPGLPGLKGTIGLTASDNKNVVKGASRTLVYAAKVNSSSRFDLLALNEPYVNPAGDKTDIDLAFRDRVTGLKGAFEVKEWSIDTQRTHLRSAERQFRIMADHQRRTGESRAWVNRRENIPAIEALGRKYGVPVYGNVATGKTATKPGYIGMDQVLDDLAKRANYRLIKSTTAGGAGLGFGLYQLVNSSITAHSELDALLDPSRQSQASWSRFGEHGSMAIGGGGFAASGGIKLANSLGYASKLAGLSRWSGRLGTGATVLAFGFVAHQYYRGELTDRQFAAAGGGMAGGVMGGIGGAWAMAGVGATVGTAIFPGPGTAIGGVVGGLIGGFAGGWAGSSLGSGAVEAYYRIGDEEMERRFVEFLGEHYKGH